MKIACLCLLLAVPAFNCIAQDSTSVSVDTSGLPLVFEPNRGQAPREGAFLTRVADGMLLLSARGVTLLPSAPKDDPNAAQEPALQLELVNSSPDKQLRGVRELPGKSNYFIGSDPSNWHTNVPQFGAVEYRSAFPGVDLVFYGNQQDLEYDYHLAAFADPGLIQMRVERGQLELDKSGDLHVHVGSRNIRLQRPRAYQEVNGIQHTIEAKFTIREQTVAFELARYDRSLPLVIDPILSYSTLIQVNNNTEPHGVAVDSIGHAYITGTTYATNYPTVAALQASNHGYTDAFVTKLNPAGNQILYSTYIGGSGFDESRAIAVDAGGNAYITGNGSPDFPTTAGAFMRTCPGICNTPFVVKILPNGTLGYSTWTGGSNIAAWAIAADATGAAYITGSSASDDLPLVNPFQSAPAGAFMVKLNPSGGGIAYSTYLGGAGDWGKGIAVDAAGSAYLVGTTTSGSMPVKTPIQLSPIGRNAFITKFAPDGRSLVFSTYYGGSGVFFFENGGESATGVAVDAFNNVHVVGTSSSCDFPLSLNAFSADCVDVSNDQKVFVLTLDPSGTHVLFSTFLPSGFSTGIAVDKKGNTYVTGITAAGSFPLLKAIQNGFQGAGSFVSEFDLTGQLKFSTLLGAYAGVQTSGIAADPNGNVYLTGMRAGDFPVVNPIPSQVRATSCCYGIFVSKISPANTPRISVSPRTLPVVALRNVSSAPLAINGITASNNYVVGGDCGSSLASGSACTLVLRPGPDNKPSTTLAVNSNAATNPQNFALNQSTGGLGPIPTFTINPSTLGFPAQFIGTTSGAQQVTLRNAGLEPVTLSSIGTSGDFRHTHNCSAVMPPASFCTVTVTYTPTSSGGLFGSLSIVHNGFQDDIFLRGSGSTSAIALSAANMQFGDQLAGATPLGRIVNITNTTPYPASVTGVTTSPGFSQTNTCSAPLSPHQSCRAAVTFDSAMNLAVTGTLTAANFGPGGPQSVNLFGNGLIVSDLKVKPSQIDFIWAIQGFPASPAAVTLTNTSNKLLTGLKFTLDSSSYKQTHTCTTSLAPGASCTVNITFTPAALGTIPSTLSIQHSGIGSPQLVHMTGMGVTALSITPNPLVAPPQVVGTTNNALGLGIGNGSGYPNAVTLNSITVQGTDFKLGKNFCPTTLDRFVGCTVVIAFKPTATGLRTGTATIVASDSSQPHVIDLQGTGISSGKGNLSTTSVAFSAQKVGTTSTVKQVTLSNNGTGALHLGQITTSPAFFLLNSTCGTTLAAGANCVLSLRFAPTLAGLLTGTLTVNDDGPNSPHLAELTGRGQ